MNPNEDNMTPEPTLLSQQAEAALQEAAKKVVEEARRTGTPVVIWQQGAVQQVPADQLGEVPKAPP
jgi:hypothetical protein